MIYKEKLIIESIINELIYTVNNTDIKEKEEVLEKIEELKNNIL